MSALTPSRDALAKAIWEASRADEGTISATGANVVADALIASGAVVAADRAFAERFLEEWAKPYFGDDRGDAVAAVLRALAAAIAERGESA